MCKKCYPTEGLADFQNFPKSITSTAKISKSKSPHFKISKSKSPHFFHVSHFLSPISPHYKPLENDLVQILHILRIFSVLFPCFLHVFSAFFQLRIFSALVMRRSTKNCGENAELRKACGDLRYGQGCLNNLIFSNLGLCAARLAHFMRHHKLWSLSVSHLFTYLFSIALLTLLEEYY